MENIIKFPSTSIKEFRNHCSFKNKAIQVFDEDGVLKNYPCIVLYDGETDIPIFYTGFERYLSHLAKSEILNSKTLLARGYAVCYFLNYLLKKTDINSLHECDLITIRNFFRFMRTKDDGEFYQQSTWIRYRDYVLDFLVAYYSSNRDILTFNYVAEELKTVMVVNDDKHHQKAKIVSNASLYVSAPKMLHKKNRILVYGYLDLILYEARKYEPGITLAIALQAYAGLREGEIVNLTCGAIKILRQKMGMISSVQITIKQKASHFEKWTKKTDPGTTKKARIQKIYSDFVPAFVDIFEYHLALMESKGLDTSADSPLFLNRQGNPMTVQTYLNRVRSLFYEHFIPSLKRTCESDGTYADNAAFIEAYEEEYPGAHMFRHWFTMYLLTKAKLTSGEIMKWRGDTSQESMNTYIHENEDLVQVFKDSSYTFQSQILEDIYE